MNLYNINNFFIFKQKKKRTEFQWNCLDAYFSLAKYFVDAI